MAPLNVERQNSGLAVVHSPGSSSSSAAGDDHTKAAKLVAGAVKAEVGNYDTTKYALSPSGTLISLHGDPTGFISTAAGSGIPQRGGKVWNRDDWLPIKGEGWKSYVHRLIFEGHTVLDAFLLTANCVGQVILTNPWALYSSGVVSGSIVWLWGLVMGIWTTWNYVALYLEYKRDKIKDGTWWDTDGEHKYVSQWFDVAGHHLGKWAKYLAMVIMAISLTGSAVVQTVASANSMYTIDPSRSKREWSLIFGGSMVLLVVITPKFTKFRLLTIIGLVGTFYGAVYGIAKAREAGPAAAGTVNLFPVTEAIRPGTIPVQNWFNGVAIMLGEASGHALIVESLESMENPIHYRKAYLFGLAFIMFVTCPHAFALNFSKYAPKLNYAQNMYALFNVDSWKRGGVIAMQTHNYIAYLLWGTQFCIIAEKALGIHTHAYWKRALMRVPFGCLWLFLALLLPFYGSINSLLTSLGGNVVSFVLLSFASLKLFARSKERRDDAVLPPYKFLQWKNWLIVHIVNAHIGLVFLGFGVASLYYAILSVQQDYHNWGFLPECYLCGPRRLEL